MPQSVADAGLSPRFVYLAVIALVIELFTNFYVIYGPRLALSGTAFLFSPKIIMAVVVAGVVLWGFGLYRWWRIYRLWVRSPNIGWFIVLLVALAATLAALNSFQMLLPELAPDALLRSMKLGVMMAYGGVGLSYGLLLLWRRPALPWLWLYATLSAVAGLLTVIYTYIPYAIMLGIGRDLVLIFILLILAQRIRILQHATAAS